MMKPTILVVDDDEGVRKLLRDALVEDYRIVEALEGYDGLSEVMIGTQKIDLIITDLKMPGLGGVKFIENIPEDIPVIIVSAFLHLPEFQGALGHLHPAAVFEKPFHINALHEAVGRALEG